MTESTLHTDSSRLKKKPLFSFGGRVSVAARQAAILDTFPGGYGEIEPDGALQLNQIAQALLKLPEVNTCAKLAALAGEQSIELEQCLNNLLSAGKQFNYVIRVSGQTIEISGKTAIAENQRLSVLWFTDHTHEQQEREVQGRLQDDQAAQLHRLKISLDAISFPCWQRESSGTIVWCNKAYADALDTTTADALSNQRELTTNLRDRNGRSLSQRALKDQEAASQPKHIVIGGNRRLMEFHEIPAEGGTVGFAVDLTQLDELRAELARHISSHAEVLETLTSAVAVFGSDQRLKFHNSALCQLLDLEENWLATQPTLAELLEHLREHRQLPEQADFRRFKQSWLNMFTSLIEPHQELMYQPDGTAIRLAIVPHPMGGLLFTFEDVTSRLQLESSYNTLIAVQRETLDNLAEGIGVFGGDGRLDLWNPAFSQMWKLADEELSGRPHITELTAKMADFFMQGEEGEALRTQLISNALDRVPRSGRMERGDNSVLQYHSVLLPDGGVLNSFLDVTDSVRVELALRERNAALIAADQLKLDFLANVSYQLRTPLNSMIGFAEILIKQYFGPLNDKQMEHARLTLEAGERLVMLIDAILDLSTIEAGYMRLHTAPIDVYNLLEDILVLAEDWAEKQEVTLLIDCDEDAGSIDADERRLKQVLLNLISNALKFTPTGGRITLGVQMLSTPGHGDELALSVADTGSGIPQADQARIFEPFAQGNKRRQSSSAGVGLALVKSFINLHGGRVELKSKQGEGTVVTCYLPVQQPLLEEG